MMKNLTAFVFFTLLFACVSDVSCKPARKDLDNLRFLLNLKNWFLENSNKEKTIHRAIYTTAYGDGDEESYEDGNPSADGEEVSEEEEEESDGEEEEGVYEEQEESDGEENELSNYKRRQDLLKLLNALEKKEIKKIIEDEEESYGQGEEASAAGEEGGEEEEEENNGEEDGQNTQPDNSEDNDGSGSGINPTTTEAPIINYKRILKLFEALEKREFKKIFEDKEESYGQGEESSAEGYEGGEEEEEENDEEGEEASAEGEEGGEEDEDDGEEDGQNTQPYNSEDNDGSGSGINPTTTEAPIINYKRILKLFEALEKKEFKKIYEEESYGQEEETSAEGAESDEEKESEGGAEEASAAGEEGGEEEKNDGEGEEASAEGEEGSYEEEEEPYHSEENSGNGSGINPPAPEESLMDDTNYRRRLNLLKILEALE